MDTDEQLLSQLSQTPELFQKIQTSKEQGIKLQNQLRKEFDPELVRAALTMGELRQRAASRFTKPDSMWFSRPELEQATPEAIAFHKAKRFRGRKVIDVGNGIGINAIAFASEGCAVESRQPGGLAVLQGKLNAESFGQSVDFQNSSEVPQSSEEALLHVHPRRQASLPKSMRLEDHLPSLETLCGLMPQFPGGAFSLSSASNFGGKFHDVEIELVSVGGECREAIIWFGELKSDVAMRATVLPANYTIAANPWECFAGVGPLGTYLYDPDAAIVRAGLVDAFAQENSLDRLDAAEEFLTSNELLDLPGATAYRVLENLPNNDRDVRNCIRKSGIGQLEIRCRHIPVDAAAFRRKITLEGPRSASLIYARLDGKARALIAERVV